MSAGTFRLGEDPDPPVLAFWGRAALGQPSDQPAAALQGVLTGAPLASFSGCASGITRRLRSTRWSNRVGDKLSLVGRCLNSLNGVTVSFPWPTFVLGVPLPDQFLAERWPRDGTGSSPCPVLALALTVGAGGGIGEIDPTGLGTLLAQRS